MLLALLFLIQFQRALSPTLPTHYAAVQGMAGCDLLVMSRHGQTGGGETGDLTHGA